DIEESAGDPRRDFKRGDTALRVKMPAHILPAILHLHCQITIHSSVHDAIVADGPIAIQTEARQMYDQGIPRSRRLDEERSGLRIPTQDARNALFIRTAGVDGRCVDGVT